ncbi:MAG: hypothetical protein ACRDXB_05325, partial [Actinomycetes bacterium]
PRTRRERANRDVLTGWSSTLSIGGMSCAVAAPPSARVDCSSGDVGGKLMAEHGPMSPTTQVVVVGDVATDGGQSG